jgi:hypothetical protein
MSVLGAAEQDRADVVTVEITVPRPRAGAPSSVAAGSSPAGGYGRRAAGQQQRPAGGQQRSAAHSPAPGTRAPGHRELRIRQVRVSELHVRELRTEERRQAEPGARQARGREARGREARGGGARGGGARGGAARSLTVHTSEVRARDMTASDVNARLVRARVVRGRDMTASDVTARVVRARVVRAREARGGGPLDGRRPRAAATGTSGRGRAGRIRLTRRGRIVLGCLAVMAATAIATAALIWFGAVGGARAASDGAQAASHGQPLAVAHRGLFRVVVRPGETLWSIARQAEPSADPRIVVQQIIDVNALSGPTIQAGELLWVPAG